jgi:uncharacterized protein with PIN domain
MTILDLDKIIIQKPDTGIHCLNCGGDLKKTDKKTFRGRFIAFITLGKVTTSQYQCVNCKKKYIVL